METRAAAVTCERQGREEWGPRWGLSSAANSGDLSVIKGTEGAGGDGAEALGEAGVQSRNGAEDMATCGSEEDGGGLCPGGEVADGFNS